MYYSGKNSLSDGVDSSHLNEEARALTSPQTHTNNHPQNKGKHQSAQGSGKTVDWKSELENTESLLTTGRICDSEHGCVKGGPGATKARPKDDTVSSVLPKFDITSFSMSLLKPPDMTGLCENNAFQVPTNGNSSKYRLRSGTEAQLMAIRTPVTFDPAKWGDHHERELYSTKLGDDEAVAKALTAHNCIIDWNASPGPPKIKKL